MDQKENAAGRASVESFVPLLWFVCGMLFAHVALVLIVLVLGLKFVVTVRVPVSEVIQCQEK